METGVLELSRTIPSSTAFTHDYVTFSTIGLAMTRRIPPYQKMKKFNFTPQCVMEWDSVFFMILTLASIGLPTTSGFTGEFLVLLGAFGSSWQTYQQGESYPLVLAIGAVGGVVLGALYMLWFAQRFLYGVTRAPHQRTILDLDFRERTILAAIVVAVFALGLYPQEPLNKTETAAREYQQLVSTARAPSSESVAQDIAHPQQTAAKTGAIQR